MNAVKVILAVAAVASFSVSAQTCKTSIIKSHPTQQFVVNSDGTVTDVINGLMWTYCSFGETFSNSACTGDPTNVSSWQAALNTVSGYSFAGHSDWRLPNIKELSHLVERSCVNPAIDLDVFPSTSSTVYWSNTPDVNHINAIPGIEGMVVDFKDGTEFVTDVNSHKLIRLVRTIN